MIEEVSARTTIVMPVWDAYVGTHLDEALASVREQSREATLVVVDNSSQVALPPMDGAVIVRAPRRLTVGAARNLGLQHVHTPYVAFWDADDVMLPRTLEYLERQIESDPRLSAYGMAIVEAETGSRHRWPRRWIRYVIGAPRLFALLDCVWSMFPATGATIMRADYVRSAGGYCDADSGEDWCLGVALAFRGRLGWNERPGRVYRVHEESLWARHLTPRDQLIHARAVRTRIRNDSAVAAWVKAALPLVQLAQYAAIGAHAVVAAGRAAVTGRRR